MNKRCIFHVPLRPRVEIKSASNIRPLHMLDAFRAIGYDVDVVMGDSRKRRSQITRIKQAIRGGVHYDFVYAESSTMPNALTDQDHIPRAPLLDARFFSYCSNRNIPIGLFYRDCYWMYPTYLPDHPIKAACARLFYEADIRTYSRYLSVLFLPDVQAFFSNAKTTALPAAVSSIEALESISSNNLPPACDKSAVSKLESTLKRPVSPMKPLRVFYVGGIGAHYDLRPLFRAVNLFSDCELTLCVREADWENVAKDYNPLLCDRIHVVHASGEDLEAYYREADVCSLVVGHSNYWKMAVPYKLYEYVAHGVPIVATRTGVAAEIVERQKIGWTVPPDPESIAALFSCIVASPEIVAKMRERVVRFAQMNTWESRAQDAVNAIMGRES